MRDRFLQFRVKPICLIGFMGAGKTTLGRLYAQRKGLRFADTDTWIEAAEGLSIADIFRIKGEAYFRQQEEFLFRERIAKDAPDVIACGGGLPTIRELWDELREKTRLVYLDAPLEILAQRIRADSTQERPLWQKDSIEALFESRKAIYSQAPYCLPTQGRSPERLVRLLDDVLEA